MNKLWNTLATFYVLYILGSLFMDRTNNRDVIESFNPSENWSSIPIFYLSFGSLLSIAVLYICYQITAHENKQGWENRMPGLWLDDSQMHGLLKKWKVVLFSLILIFPIVLQVHFWRRFHDWQAWSNVKTPEVVSLYELVSPAYLLSWDSYRYGDFSNMNEEGWHGVSYVPFWQPVIMLTLSLITLYMSWKAISLIFKSPQKEQS